MEININKVQDEAREFLRKNQINETIQYLENFIRENKIRDDDFSDALVSLSQRNRVINGYDIIGSITYQENLTEKTIITKKLLSLTNEIPHIIKQRIQKEAVQNIVPAITYLEKVQDESLIEVRGKMMRVDSLLLILFNEMKEKEKQLVEFKGRYQEMERLKTEIEELNRKVEAEKEQYNKLKLKYDDLKKEKQKVYELDFQIETLRAKLEGKERELEVLRESFIISKQLMDSQRRELEKFKDKYE